MKLYDGISAESRPIYPLTNDLYHQVVRTTGTSFTLKYDIVAESVLMKIWQSWRVEWAIHGSGQQYDKSYRVELNVIKVNVIAV